MTKFRHSGWINIYRNRCGNPQAGGLYPTSKMADAVAKEHRIARGYVEWIEEDKNNGIDHKAFAGTACADSCGTGVGTGPGEAGEAHELSVAGSVAYLSRLYGTAQFGEDHRRNIAERLRELASQIDPPTNRPSS